MHNTNTIFLGEAMKIKLLLACMIAVTTTHAENPKRWDLFWQHHPGFSRVAGAEDYALQVTTNQYALDDLSQELSRGVTESRRKDILQEITNRRTAVTLLEEQIATMMPAQEKGLQAK